MARTQGLAAAGIFSSSIWAIGTSVVSWRQGMLPLPLTVLGIFPNLPWPMGLLGRTGLQPDILWLLDIGSLILGVPLWSVMLAGFLLRQNLDVSGRV